MMRDPFPDVVERGRVKSWFSHWTSRPGDHFGAFQVLGPCGRGLRIIASDGKDDRGDFGWEHVSVSLEGTKRETARLPNWQEMSFVKDLFWSEDECVIQYHPPCSVYVNWHGAVLHLWKPTKAEIPIPPTWMVGSVDGQTIRDALREADRAEI